MRKSAALYKSILFLLTIAFFSTSNLMAIGTTTISPEMDIEEDGTPYADGSTFDFGENEINIPLDVFVTIYNTGNATLTLGDQASASSKDGKNTDRAQQQELQTRLSTGRSIIAITGTNADQFSVETQPTTPISAGSNSIFTLRFTPTSVGAKTANISIANNDSDENPYDLTLTGSGALAFIPDLPGDPGDPGVAGIQVEGNETTIEDGDTTPSTSDNTDFGLRHVPDDSVTLTFYVENTGDADLVLTSPGASLSGSSNFTIISQPDELTIPAQGKKSFTVRYTPTTADTADATISIAHNADDSPYTFAVQGRGGMEKLQVTGAEVLVNGDTYPTIEKGTHFGKVLLNAPADTLSFTVKNTGSWPLRNLDGYSDNSKSFGLLFKDKMVSLLPDSSTIVKIVFRPEDEGVDSTGILLAGDNGAAAFRMTLKGEGTWLGVVKATVFCDNNANGAQDDGENGLKDIVVTINQKDDKVEYAKAKTNGAGQVKFDDLNGGEYTITIDETTLPKGGACTTGGATASVTIGKEKNLYNPAFGYFYTDSTVTEEHNQNAELTWNLPLSFVDGSPCFAKEPWSNAVDGKLWGWDGTATVKADENGQVWAIFKVEGGPCQFDRMTIITDNHEHDPKFAGRQISKVQILTSVTGPDSASFNTVAEINLNNEQLLKRRLENVYHLNSTIVAAYIKVVVLAPNHSPEAWRQIVEIALGEMQQIEKKGAELESVELPADFSLSQNYPNPFNPTTSISYTLPDAKHVDIAVYNIKGDRVKQLVSGHQDAGQFNISWDATNAVGQKVTTGVYFYRINAGELTETKKMTLMQ
jgi:hypothetical protein